jgi:molybdenum cofactor cytidylyltransferase
MPELSEYAVIILAAGNSSRLGEPKQLLQYQDKTLIRHITEAASDAKSATVFVVTGSSASLIEAELDSLPVEVVRNPHWETGMASSIVAGLNELIRIHPNIAGAIFAVSDQPFVNAELFNALIEKASGHNAGIVASAYDNTFGTPVLFSSKYFPFLLQLSGTDGAKQLIKKFTDNVISIPFPLGGVDIDTQEDYQKLLTSS